MHSWLVALDNIRKMKEGEFIRPPYGVPYWCNYNAQLRHSLLTQGFPAVTTKKLAFKQVVAELAAFLGGCDTLECMHSYGCKIWDDDAKKNDGKLGRIYGAQWRSWLAEDGTHVDQIAGLVEAIKYDPTSRRHVLQSYNPGAVDACLPACHTEAHFYVRSDRLNVTVSMRSCDMFLGFPFDIASYAVLLSLLAKETGYKADELCFNITNAHIYANHKDAVNTVLSRKPLPPPKLKLSPRANIFRFTPEQIKLLDYRHHGAVPAPMNTSETVWEGF